ncbi:MAG TPA: hypothetical protein VHP11_15530 [Tepidisphaeraceae bacterium]|nr:hypothetical protein [Tepidisphaeraceae bacterium]
MPCGMWGNPKGNEVSGRVIGERSRRLLHLIYREGLGVKEAGMKLGLEEWRAKKEHVKLLAQVRSLYAEAYTGDVLEDVTGDYAREAVGVCEVVQGRLGKVWRDGVSLEVA